MTKLGYTLTLWWCQDCLPDGLDGLDPMTPLEADNTCCEGCGADLHGDDASLASPNKGGG